MGAVYLAEDMTSIQEQYLIISLCSFLAFVQEPQCAGQSDGVEKVASDRCHHINHPILDELFADVSDPDVIAVFENLQRASLESHLPAFERYLENGGQGSGMGQGKGQGRGGKGRGNKGCGSGRGGCRR